MINQLIDTKPSTGTLVLDVVTVDEPSIGGHPPRGHVVDQLVLAPVPGPGLVLVHGVHGELHGDDHGGQGQRLQQGYDRDNLDGIKKGRESCKVSDQVDNEIK